MAPHFNSPLPPLSKRLAWEAHLKVAGWRRCYRTGILVALLLAGCTSWNRPAPLPPELTEAGVQARLRIAADSNVNPADTIGKLRDRSESSEIPDLNTGVKRGAYPNLAIVQGAGISEKKTSHLCLQSKIIGWF